MPQEAWTRLWKINEKLKREEQNLNPWGNPGVSQNQDKSYAQYEFDSCKQIAKLVSFEIS